MRPVVSVYARKYVKSVLYVRMDAYVSEDLSKLSVCVCVQVRVQDRER